MTPDWVKAGQKVECIAKGDWSNSTRSIMPWANVPKPGGTYTIREVYVDPATKEIGIRLVEVVNAPITTDGYSSILMEVGWCWYEFRPLTERKTDISVFTKILEPA